MLLFLLLLMLLLLFLPRSLLLLLLILLSLLRSRIIRNCGVMRDHDATPCVKSPRFPTNQSTFSTCSNNAASAP